MADVIPSCVQCIDVANPVLVYHSPACSSILLPTVLPRHGPATSQVYERLAARLQQFGKDCWKCCNARWHWWRTDGQKVCSMLALSRCKHNFYVDHLYRTPDRNYIDRRFHFCEFSKHVFTSEVGQGTSHQDFSSRQKHCRKLSSQHLCQRCRRWRRRRWWRWKCFWWKLVGVKSERRRKILRVLALRVFWPCRRTFAILSRVN